MNEQAQRGIAAVKSDSAVIPGAIAIASGKGGVGKTWLSITLAQALSRNGERVVLFDGDLGLANVDIQLGLTPAIDLGTAIERQLPLARAVTRSAAGFDVIAGRSGSGGLANMPLHRLSALIAALRDVATQYDRVIIDLGAGIDRPVRLLAAQCETALVVANDEPTTLTDAYALIKMLTSDQAPCRVGLVVNSAQDTIQGQQTYATLSKACQNFLKLDPPLLGIIRRDPKVKEAIRAQAPLLTRHPGSIAAQDVEALAGQIPLINLT
ncbi:MinD/ParA family protein [Dongia rigui]|uniref:MinD/ParA family protein n=1 Tax=Dongia rigui TaxID=940149 RepID=A0ABU5DTN8_9PROT|nr:MinD/ParA family protein [Dongia rigui]MDY0870568.1 MinD/ParA family protein [Dongia rigui]